MHYYLVDTLIDFGGSEKLLTYHSEEPLAIGSVATVPFGRSVKLGIIRRTTSKPKGFGTKAVTEVIADALSDETIRFADWMRSYYPVRTDELQRLFLPTFLKTHERVAEIEIPNPVNATKGSHHSEIELTTKQREAKITILASETPVLLHGDMGSGKSIIYLAAAKETLDSGKSALLLTPEIPLATQLQRQARTYFGDEYTVHLYHSEMTAKQRRAVWKGIATATKPYIVIGPRSALFLPYKDLGFISVDEMHENSYKQQESPFYNALDGASMLAKLHGAHIVFGSATPPIKEYYYAEQKGYPIIRIDTLAKQTETSQRTIEIIDKKSAENFGSDDVFSTPLLHEIKVALAHKKQVLIFHNRRGSALLIMCEQCGYTHNCPACDVPMTYHHDAHRCQCNICGKLLLLPPQCPRCGNPELLLRGIGIKAIEQRLRKLFPSARIARFDSDNKKAETLASRFDELKRGDIDIIVGTQLIAKGLDLLSLKVVGVTNSDTNLALPDYTSTERMFQLLFQVSGRVGRGHGDGVVILQTLQPEHIIFDKLLAQKWADFYVSELRERESFLYPPFVHLLKLTLKGKTPSTLKKKASAYADELRVQYPKGVSVLGPTEPFHAKQGLYYCQQVIVKAKRRDILLRIAKSAPAKWITELEPLGLL